MERETVEHMSSPFCVYEWRVQAILSLFSIIELPNGALSCNLNFLCNFARNFSSCAIKQPTTTAASKKRFYNDNKFDGEDHNSFFFNAVVASAAAASHIHTKEEEEAKNGIKSLVLCYRFIVIKTNDQRERTFPPPPTTLSTTKT